MLFVQLDRIDDERTELQRYLRKSTPKKDSLWALTLLCQTYFEAGLDREDGLPCTKQLVEEFPDDPEALYLRALGFYLVHDPAAVEFATRFRKVANASDPTQRQEIAQMDKFANPNGQAIQQ